MKHTYISIRAAQALLQHFVTVFSLNNSGIGHMADYRNTGVSPDDPELADSFKLDFKQLALKGDQVSKPDVCNVAAVMYGRVFSLSKLATLYGLEADGSGVTLKSAGAGVLEVEGVSLEGIRRVHACIAAAAPTDATFNPSADSLISHAPGIAAALKPRL